MMRLNVVELRQSLADILNRAEYQGERIVIHRRGKDAAAIIPIEDLKLLERLIEDAEDRLRRGGCGPPWPSPTTASPTRRSAADWGSTMSKKRNRREPSPEPSRYRIGFTRAAERVLASLPKSDLRPVDTSILRCRAAIQSAPCYGLSSGRWSSGFGRKDRRNTAAKSGNNILAGQLILLLEPTKRKVESINANRPIRGIDDPDEGHSRPRYSRTS